jgi:hypothetical protein
VVLATVPSSPSGKTLPGTQGFSRGSRKAHFRRGIEPALENAKFTLVEFYNTLGKICESQDDPQVN